jgi:hypothetical protein
VKRRLVLSGFLAGALLHPGLVVAQPGAILLQLRPRAGDTLRLRLDQTVELVGTVRNGENEITSTESSTLILLTRLAIESSQEDGATVLALTDSVRLSSPPNTASGSLLAWAKGIEGQKYRFHVAPDGSTSLVGTGSWGSPQVGAMIAQMPATLPRKPIVLGATWGRVMEVPMSGALGTRGTMRLTATFKFDSLSKSGELAFLSMRGRLTRDGAEATGREKETVEAAGTVTGQMLVDRRRGWITEARTTISVHSLIVPSEANRPAMKVRMTITQWMRAM